MTFSIVARSDDGETWGVAVASKFLAVGSAVPAAVAGVGAIATQAWANVSYKGLALAHLDEGATAQVALDRLLEEDDGRDHRQVGLVDVEGSAAAHTGAECIDWAGHRTGEGYAVQGNCLTGPEVVEAVESAWLAGAEQPFAVRLLAALRAGDDAGGDKRGRQSAAMLVVREEAGYGGFDDIAVDLRVDDHTAPVTEMERLLALHDLYLTASTPQEQVPVDEELRAEIEAYARGAGHPDAATWVGSENYEMRVADDLSWIDRRGLAVVRGEGAGA
ncbi:MAG: fimbrial assembly protein FimA [Nocardioides sp.]|nr:fimbrial assembly protein FimA [Nocardioides sp.]